MKIIQGVVLCLSALSCLATPLQAKLLINEALVNPRSTPDNPREFVEIISTTMADSLTDVWLLEIGNEIADDDISPGTIVNAIELSPAASMTGYTTRGLIVLGEDYSTSNPWGITGADAALLDLDRTSFDVPKGDFDRSGLVGDGDYSIWESNLGMQTTAVKRHGNYDDDGDVDGVDFLSWQQSFGQDANPFGAPNNGLQNIDIQNSVDLVLVEGFSGVIGDDVDINNDGILDGSLPWVTQLDVISLGNVEAFPGDLDVDDYNYYGVAPQEPSNSTPDSLTRFVGNTDDSDPDAWFGGEGRQSNNLDLQYSASASQLTDNFPAGGPYSLTPGDYNDGPAPAIAAGIVPEPSTVAFVSFVIGVLPWMRRR